MWEITLRRVVKCNEIRYLRVFRTVLHKGRRDFQPHAVFKAVEGLMEEV